MKAYLKFDMEDPDDKDLLQKVQQVDDFMLALYDFDQYLRQITRYGKEEDQKLDAQTVRDKLWEIINERNIQKYI